MTVKGSEKTIYVPYMCDHGYVVVAALAAQGLRTEGLPPPDDESLAIGLDLCRGRECSPCLLTTGDIIRRARRPDFNPAMAVLLLGSATGLCRFGQYKVLQRAILDENGLAEVEIIAPDSRNSYQGFGDHPTTLRRLIWQGVVAVDLLQKLRHQYRPYELERGQTERLYQQRLAEIVGAVRSGGGGHLVRAMKLVARGFETLPVAGTTLRPLIGVIGEIYLRFNEFSNQHIVRQIEATGGEAVVASIAEWFYFTNWLYADLSRKQDQFRDWLVTLLSDLCQKYDERRLVKPVEHLLRDPHETAIADVMRGLQPHYDPLLGLESEAGLSLGKAIDFTRKGVCGVVNIMPFSCMPGIVVAGMASRFRAGLNDVPWLDISYDAQGGTNIQTRLEAFIYQARQYQRQVVSAPPAVQRARKDEDGSRQSRSMERRSG